MICIGLKTVGIIGSINYLANSKATKRMDLSIHNDENTNMKDYLRVWSNKSKTLTFFLTSMNSNFFVI